MANYPNSFDDSTTLPPASGDDATSVNATIGVVEAIETALGLLPQGPYSSARVRFDILEARINNPLAPSPNVLNPFIIGNTGVTITAGNGAPSSSAVPGSVYLREDGYITTTIYVFATDGLWHPLDLIAGALTLSTRTITGNYTVDSISADYVILCNASGAISITLPTVTIGRQLIIKDISGNAATNHITISPVGGAQIDGTSSFTIATNRGSVTLSADNTNWYIT